MQSNRNWLKRVSAALAATVMAAGGISPVYADDTPVVAVTGDLLINADTGTDVIKVEKDTSFSMQIELGADFKKAFEENWLTPATDEDMKDATTNDLKVIVTGVIPVSEDYFDMEDPSKIEVFRGSDKLPASGVKYENGNLIFKDTITLAADMPMAAILALLEYAPALSYTIKPLSLTDAGEEAQAVTLTAGVTISVDGSFQKSFEAIVDTEEEAEALISGPYVTNGSAMENPDGPGYVADYTKTIRTRAAGTATQKPEGAYSAFPSELAIAITAQEEAQPEIKTVEIHFVDKDDSDKILSDYTKVYEVDPTQGLEIDLSETVGQLKELGYIVGRYPTKITGQTEVVEVELRHDTEEEIVNGEKLTATRQIRYVCGNAVLNTATQGAEYTPQTRITRDAVTKKEISRETTDGEMTLPAVESPKIDGYTTETPSVPEIKGPASEVAKMSPIYVTVEYAKTEEATSRTVAIVFEDINETDPQDLSEFNKNIEVRGKTLPNGEFVADEAVPAGIEDTVHSLVEKGYVIQGTAPKTVDGSKEEIHVTFKHGMRNSTETETETVSRSIILVIPGKDDRTETQGGTRSTKTVTVLDAVTGKAISSSKTYSVSFDAFPAPKIEGMQPSIQAIPAFVVNDALEPITDDDISDSTIEYHVSTMRKSISIIFDCTLEDGTLVEELSKTFSLHDDECDTDYETEIISKQIALIENSAYDIVSYDARARSYLVPGETGMIMEFEYVLRPSETAVTYNFNVSFEHPTDDLSENNQTVSFTYKADPGSANAENDLAKELEPIIKALEEKGYTYVETSLVPKGEQTDQLRVIDAVVSMDGGRTNEKHTITIKFEDIAMAGKTDLSEKTMTFTAQHGEMPEDFIESITAVLDELYANNYLLVSSAQVDALTFEEDAEATFFVGHKFENNETNQTFTEADKVEKYARPIIMHFDDGRDDRAQMQYGSGTIRKTVRKDLVTGEETTAETLMRLHFNKLVLKDSESGYVADVTEIPEKTINGPLPIDTKVEAEEVNFKKKDTTKHNVYFVVVSKVLEDYTLHFDLVDNAKPEGYEEAINAVLEQLKEKGYIVTPVDEIKDFSTIDRYVYVEYDITSEEVKEETPVKRTIRISAPSGHNIPAETVQEGVLTTTKTHYTNRTTGEEWDIVSSRVATFKDDFHLPAIDGYALDGTFNSVVVLKEEYKEGSLDVQLSYKKKSDSSTPAKPADNKPGTNSKTDNQQTKPNAKSGNANTGTGAPVVPIIIGGTAAVGLLGALIYAIQKRKKDKEGAENNSENSDSE